MQLRENERNVTIKASKFISENFSNKKLFYTFNHPSVELIAFIANSILKYLDIKDTIEPKNIKETLDFIRFPIHSSIYKHLNLKFDTEKYYFYKLRFTNKIIFKRTILEQTKILFDKWNNNEQAVQKNQEIMAKYKTLGLLPSGL